MRQFYLLFQNVAPMGQLSWSHYRILITIKDDNERNYYMNRCVNNNLTKRQLEEIKKLNEYKRLPEKTKNKLITKEETNVQDQIKNLL